MSSSRPHAEWMSTYHLHDIRVCQQTSGYQTVMSSWHKGYKLDGNCQRCWKTPLFQTASSNEWWEHTCLVRSYLPLCFLYWCLCSPPGLFTKPWEKSPTTNADVSECPLISYCDVTHEGKWHVMWLAVLTRVSEGLHWTQSVNCFVKIKRCGLEFDFFVVASSISHLMRCGI